MFCESRIGGMPGSGSASTAGTGDELPTGPAGNVDGDAEGGSGPDLGAAFDETASGELIGPGWGGECCAPGDAPALLWLKLQPAAPNAASATIATVRPVARPPPSHPPPASPPHAGARCRFTRGRTELRRERDRRERASRPIRCRAGPSLLQISAPTGAPIGVMPRRPATGAFLHQAGGCVGHRRG